MNSIKCNSLRIGNIVKIRDTGEIVRVCGLLLKSVQYRKELGDENDYRYCRYVDIEGVLIYDHWQKIDYPELEWRDVWGDGKWYKYKIWNMSVYKTIRYIHELQNLHYALSGEELKIEL